MTGLSARSGGDRDRDHGHDELKSVEACGVLDEEGELVRVRDALLSMLRRNRIL
jgi:hypothetical protein